MRIFLIFHNQMHENDDNPKSQGPLKQVRVIEVE